MGFDIGKIEKRRVSVWVEFMGDPETRILFRHITQDEYEALSRSATIIKFDPKSHVRQETRDDEKFRELLVDAVVVDWTGFNDNDEPWPCTPENRHYLMEKSTDFRLLVLDVPLSLEKMLAIEREEMKKKS